MTASSRQINLPEGLCSAAEKLYGKRFPNVEALVVFLLQEITREDAAKIEVQEQRIIEERLKALGYI